VEMSPQRVRSAEFKTARKGADLDEVRVFLNDVADELERAQNQSAAMEARARAAVARLQELNEVAAAPAPTVDASVEEAETISRTLLLAQRTADTTVAEARADAARILSEAKDEAARTLDSTREMSAQMIEEARLEARRIGETEREDVAGEVEALKARRDFLESDVHHLETFLVDQRARVREAASSLFDVVDRVPGGLGEVRGPLLSASDDDSSGANEDLLIVADIAESGPEVGAVEESDSASAAEEGVAGQSIDESARVVSLDTDPWADDVADAGEPTEAMPVVNLDDDNRDSEQPDGGSPQPDREPGSEFRFSFDDERP